MKEVSEVEFKAFLSSYGKELTKDFCAIGEPPKLDFYDFSLSENLREARVAYSVLWSMSYNPADKDTFFIRDQT